MPNRTLRESFVTSGQVSAVSIGAEALLVRLMLIADDFGRLDGRVSIVRCKALPLRDVSAEIVERWLVELSEQQLIRRYSADGLAVIAICDWRQRGRAKASRFPPPSEAGVADTNLGAEEMTGSSTSTDMHSPVEGPPKVSRMPIEKHAEHIAARPEAIVALHNKLLTEFDQIPSLSSELRELIVQRIQDSPVNADFRFWIDFFKRALARADIVFGVSHKSRNLPWLLDRTNFDAILSGKPIGVRATLQNPTSRFERAASAEVNR